MTFNQLKYVLEIVAAGSFSAAAQKLGLTQPALSLQIQTLENELDFKIIDRSRKPFALTPEGELFVVKAREIVLMTESLSNLSLELSSQIKGVLRVGIIPTLSPYLVPLFIGVLSRNYPELQTVIQEMVTEEIISRLNRGELDAGILSTPLDAPARFEPLFYEKFFLYVSDTHPFFELDEVKPGEINPDEMWYLHEGNCFQNQVNAICPVNNPDFSGQLRYVSNSIESLRRIVESKNGATFIPELATIGIPAEQEELVKPIAAPTPYREISLALSRLHSKEKLVQAFKETLLANIPERMKHRPEGERLDTRIRIK
ncbi:MAG: hydrogen peroxide-inducible genes activator [Prolixibacteraceae bacterium]|nr:hydrogen peroxide-inducible genes activator [Prolixibacteraceae bacterium]